MGLERTKCSEQSCREAPTVRAHGPHGLTDYCDDHARQYVGLMGFMGASVLLMPIPTPTPEGSDAEG